MNGSYSISRLGSPDSMRATARTQARYVAIELNRLCPSCSTLHTPHLFPDNVGLVSANDQVGRLGACSRRDTEFLNLEGERTIDASMCASV